MSGDVLDSDIGSSSPMRPKPLNASRLLRNHGKIINLEKQRPSVNTFSSPRRLCEESSVPIIVPVECSSDHCPDQKKSRFDRMRCSTLAQKPEKPSLPSPSKAVAVASEIFPNRLSSLWASMQIRRISCWKSLGHDKTGLNRMRSKYFNNLALFVLRKNEMDFSPEGRVNIEPGSPEALPELTTFANNEGLPGWVSCSVCLRVPLELAKLIRPYMTSFPRSHYTHCFGGWGEDKNTQKCDTFTPRLVTARDSRLRPGDGREILLI